MTAPAELEPRIHEIGTRLFAAMADEGRVRTLSPIFGGRAVQRRVLARAAEDPHFKTQLFRFIDVYPSLRDSGDLVRHLRAYLTDRGELPRPLDRLVGPDGGRRLPSWAVARFTERTMQRMAKGLIAGRDAGEVFVELKRLRRHHTAFTLDILGEACLSEAEAEEYARRYFDVLETLPPKAARWSADPFLDEAPWGEIPRVNLSLKMTSLYSQIDPADFDGSRRALVSVLKPLFLKARDHGVFMGVDLERFAYRDLTYAVFKDLAMDPELVSYPHIGITVQAYLRDSADDVQNLVELARGRGAPITVRLVKGAYWDYETIAARQEHWPEPVFSRKAETDAQFERLAKVLVENCELTRPALGTHNIRSIAAALAMAEAAGLAPRSVELQMLHGMAEPIRKAAVDQHYRVREYVPMGEVIPGMAYLVRRLLENTSNESFLRLTFAQHLDQKQLLAAPGMGNSADRITGDASDTAPPSQPTAPTAEAAKAAPSPTGPRPFENEPHTDFSIAAHRATMEKALATIRGSLGREYALVIDGVNVQTETRIDSVNPARPGEIVGSVATATREHADKALAAAQAAFPAWRDTPASDRAAILFRAAALMRQRRFELAALEVVEAGKPWREADGDVTEAIDFMEFYGREMIRLSTIRDLSDVPGEEDLYLYEPRGVAAVIAPWNFPLAIPTGMVSAALVAGNTVVLKPASTTPVLGYALVSILHEAGVPGGAVNFLPGAGGEIGDYLAADPRVDLIPFTGSLEVGLSIMRQATVVAPGQRNIKRVIAEMGGKNAIIVDTDADLDAAVEGVVTSAFGYAGQKCSACSRVIVLDSIHDQFVRRLTQAAASLIVGDPADPAVRVGPVIGESARDKILAYIAMGKSEARLILPVDGAPLSVRIAASTKTSAVEAAAAGEGVTEPSPVAPDGEATTGTDARPDEGPGDSPAVAPPEAPAEAVDQTPAAAEPASEPDSAPGYFIPPHIFVDVASDSTIAQDEIFGPVLVVLKAHKFGQALEMALAVRYGLTGGLYSRNPNHIRRAVRDYRVGNLYINRPVTGAMVGRQPFGGSRMSGVGSKAGGPDYLLQFMEPRTITENTIRRGFAPAPEDAE
jgi:RHH-type transcriptional regulator, proline utilization regulon repressor / proline dehydrogenase / delta 1-pyrroline-5-carboxylate dehydrogenase